MANVIEVDVLIEIRKSTKELEKLRKQVKNFQKTAEEGFGKATSTFDIFKGALAAGIAQKALFAIKDAIIGLGAAAISKAAEIETLTTQIGTLTGSVEQAEDILKSLQKFAATTPFQLPGLAQASKQLLAFGFEVNEILPKMQQLGDVAAGSGASLQGLATLFGQVAAAGKLTGERLLQFQERAIPIGPAIAKTLGVTESAVKDLVSAGKVDFAVFEQAFASLSEEGGKFFEGMVRQSKTFDGVTSTLRDNIDLLLVDLGQELLPIVKEIALNTIEWIQANRELIKSFSVASVQLVVDVWNTLTDVIDVVKNTISGLSNILIGVLGRDLSTIKLGIDELSIAMVGGTGVTGQFKEEQEASARALAQKTKRLEEAAAAQKRIDAVNATILAEEKTRRAEAKALEDEAFRKEQERRKLREAEEKKHRESLAAVRKAFNLLDAEESTLLQAQKDEKTTEVNQQDRDVLTAQLLAIQLQKIDAQIKEAELLGNHLLKIQLLRDKAAIIRQKKEKKSNALFMKQEDATKQFQAKTTKEKLAGISAGLDGAASLMSSGNKTAFRIGKAAAISQVLLNIPSSASSAFNAMIGIPVVGPALAFAAAGAAVAAQLLQANKIRSQQPPSFQQGGIVPGGFSSVDNTVARVGSGEMILNRIQQTNLLRAINSGQLGGGGASINIQGDLIVDDDSRIDRLITEISNRVEFGNSRLLSTAVV